MSKVTDLYLNDEFKWFSFLYLLTTSIAVAQAHSGQTLLARSTSFKSAHYAINKSNPPAFPEHANMPAQPQNEKSEDEPTPQSTHRFIENLKKNYRAQNYLEWMGHSIAPGVDLPNPQGNTLTKTFVDGRLWMDYAIGSQTRLLYWQRYTLAATGNHLLHDPRLGIRLTQNVPLHFSSTHDFYILPGISYAAHENRRLFELGVRSSSTYFLKDSHWRIGYLFEINGAFYHSKTPPNNLYGTLAPYANYAISEKFSTQHWLIIPYKIKDTTFYWDSPGMPFVQNGMAWNITAWSWLGILINNYVGVLPSLRNTWASLWLNIALFPEL